MVQLESFYVEQWMDDNETKAKYNIAETCCASISLNDLAAISEKKDAEIISPLTKLTYGEIPGLKELRTNLANLYSSKTANPLSPDQILITPGAIAANHLTFYGLVSRGDHVICHYPTYQQLYEIPASLGADVDLWKAKSENKWIPDIDELKQLIKENTKLIVINNPNNPTGAILPKSLLGKITEVAKERGIIVLSDEVYRPVFHSITPISDEFPPSLLSMGYENTIATGSLSKAYSLAGIRVGWIASRSPIVLKKIYEARHYTTISVSQLDSQVAAHALSPDTIHSLIARNIQLAKTNLEMLERFVIKHDDVCDWVKPLAGTTAFIRFHHDGRPVDSVKLCKRLIDETGVLLVPGSHSFGAEYKGYVRFGFVCETDVLKDGLEKMRLWMRKEFDDVELADQ